MIFKNSVYTLQSPLGVLLFVLRGARNSEERCVEHCNVKAPGIYRVAVLQKAELTEISFVSRNGFH